MTSEQALQILVEATRNISATRDQHQAIIQALETLKKAVDEKSQGN
jgi:hypothetical protein